MDQTGALTISVPMFLGSIGLTWFLLARAPELPRELTGRATESTVRLRLVGSALLRDLRNDLNVALRDYDEGNDPYLTRVKYQVPSETLRGYRKIMLLEKAARLAPGQVRKRLRVAVIIAIVLTILFFSASVLAALESFIGLLPCYIILGASSVLVAIGLILSVFFFVVPYSRVSKSELRGQEELKARPGLHSIAEALEVDVDNESEGEDW